MIEIAFVFNSIHLLRKKRRFYPHLRPSLSFQFFISLSVFIGQSLRLLIIYYFISLYEPRPLFTGIYFFILFLSLVGTTPKSLYPRNPCISISLIASHPSHHCSPYNAIFFIFQHSLYPGNHYISASLTTMHP